MSAPPLSLRWLRPILEQRYDCRHTKVIGADEVVDPKHTDALVPAVHAFERDVGHRTLIATIYAYGESLPIPRNVVRSFLVRLDIDINEIAPQ